MTIKGPAGRIILLTEQALGEFGQQFVFILIPYLLVATYHLDPAGLATVSSAASLSAMCGSIVISVAARHLQTRNLAAGGAIMTAFALFLLVLSVHLVKTSVIPVAIIYLLITLLSSSYTIGTVVAVTRVTSSQDQYFALNGKRNLVQSISSIAAPSLIGVAMMIVSTSSLIACAILTWLISAAVFFYLLQGQDNSAPESIAATDKTDHHRRNMREHIASLGAVMSTWRNTKGIIQGLIAPVLAALSRRLVMTILPFFLVAGYAASSVDYGIVYSAGGVGYLVGASLCSKENRLISTRHGNITLIVTLTGLVMAALFLMYDHRFNYLVGACMFTAFSGALSLLIDVCVTSHRQRSLAIDDLASLTAIADTFDTVAVLLGATISGVIATLWSVRAVFLVSAVLYLVIAVSCLSVMRHLNAPKSHAPASSASHAQS